MDEASAAFASLQTSNGKEEADERDPSLHENSEEESWDEVEIPEEELTKEIVEEKENENQKKIFDRVESTESGDELDETKPCAIEPPKQEERSKPDNHATFSADNEPDQQQQQHLFSETTDVAKDVGDLADVTIGEETSPCLNINTAMSPSTNAIMTSPSAAPPSPVHSPPFASPPARLYNITPLKLALPPTASSSITIATTDNDTSHNTSTNTTNFAQIIRERTQQRRAREDAAVSELRVQVHRLEAALAAESKRRVAAVQQIHQQSVRAVAELEERLQQTVQEEQERGHERMARLEERCRQLELRWQDDVGAVQDSVQHHGMQIQSQMTALQQTVATERQQRTSREHRLRTQMQEMADMYQELWKKERQDRLQQFGTLQETMNSVYSARNSDVASFQGRITRAVEDLQRAVDQEQQERHASDEDIVDALNRYSKNLQESLAAASGAAYY